MIVIKNIDVFDGLSPDVKENHHVVIEKNKIREVSPTEPLLNKALVIDGCGHTLMPGLIDAHFHACLVQVDGFRTETLPGSLLYSSASKLLEGTLKRGFTTVRDAGGADYGLAHATETGIIKGPRIFFSGRPLTQTGGHGDMRSRLEAEPCLCSSHGPHLVHVVDGVDEVRKAAREEFRKGAHQLKLMLNGGVSSDEDPVWLCQFADDEILAAIEEAHRRKSYVMAHLYMDAQIDKAVKLGVRSVEHGNFLSAETARLMTEKDAFLVPTMVTYKALAAEGHKFGFTEKNFEKLAEVQEAGFTALENAKAAQVNVGFGTDLLGQMHRFQCDEFDIRREVFTPFEVLKSATSTNAALVNRQGQLGEISEGAAADLLLVKGNPLTDLSVFDEEGSKLSLIMKNGYIMSIQKQEVDLQQND